jgi:hypothetical protein
MPSTSPFFLMTMAEFHWQTTLIDTTLSHGITGHNDRCKSH